MIQAGKLVADLTSFCQVFYNKLMANYFFAFLFIGGLLSPVCWAQTSSEVYGIYNLYPQGSSRVMGMGGAYAALSDHPTGVVANPAGLAFSEWKFDLSGTFNRVTNREAKTENRTDNAVPFDYFQYALALGWESWALGLGWSQPFYLETDNLSGEVSKIKVQSGDVALAKKFGKYFSLGLSYHYELFEHTFESTNPFLLTPKTTVETQGGYVRAGLNYRSQKGGVGLVWVQERIYDIDESVNSTLSNHSPFRDGISPSKVTVGIYAQVTNRLTFVLDLDTISEVKNGVYAGSGYFGDGTGVEITQKEQTVFHGGIEFEAVNKKTNEVYIRAGGYQEPARLVDAKVRTHYTLGLEARFGPAVLSVAFDQAENFNNTSQGFSLAIGSL